MAQYLGNTNTKEVHNLFNRQTNCQINEIRFEHRRDFSSLAVAHAQGFDNCAYCIGGSTR